MKNRLTTLQIPLPGEVWLDPARGFTYLVLDHVVNDDDADAEFTTPRLKILVLSPAEAWVPGEVEVWVPSMTTRDRRVV